MSGHSQPRRSTANAVVERGAFVIKSIRVDMLKGLSVWIDDEPLLINAAKINKPWQVFCYLVLNRAAPVSSAQLIETLWGEGDLADPANVLKNTVYALRREFKKLADDAEPILYTKGGYICNPKISFSVDVEDFDTTCQAAAATDGEQRLELLKKAAAIYKGNLLPQIDQEVWVMSLSLLYRERYSSCMHALLEALEAAEDYSALLTEATAASQIDRLEETYYLYIFRALYAMGMYRVIIPTYHKAVRIFSEELGATLGPEIRHIYSEATEKINQIEQDIMIIKDDLKEVTGGKGPVKGPLYCTYDVFKYLYQMIARSSERSRQRILVVLLSLQMQDGSQPPARDLSAAMNHVKSGILGGLLRRSDTMARYSNSQYIIMLSAEHTAGADVVMGRLRKRFEPFLEQREIQMVFAMAELDPLA